MIQWPELYDLCTYRNKLPIILWLQNSNKQQYFHRSTKWAMLSHCHGIVWNVCMLRNGAIWT